MTDRITTIRAAQDLVKKFAERNQWSDTPNIDKLDHLHKELTEMSKHLRYKTEEERIRYVEENKEIFKDGVGDLFFGLCRLANQMNIDVEEAFNMVKDEIFSKYNHMEKENKMIRE